MLKGHVFSKQLFGNPIFALFINTFLNGVNGVSNNFKNGMTVTYSGSVLTVDSGAVCVQGRFLEEDSSTQVAAGTDTAYCKLVIEIDLDKQNTESTFAQGAYKVVKSNSGYPNLTQTNIVKNVSGIYQYELARFRTTTSGIVDFQDMRTFLDFQSIYNKITQEYQAVLSQLQEALENLEDQSDELLNQITEEYQTVLAQLQEELEAVETQSNVLLKTGGTVSGEIEISDTGNITGNISANARNS